MKPNTRVLDYASTVQGESIGMTIDSSAFAHIMSVLTDLYSDPVLAVIREYSTNALDAHREAGVKRPIEVTLPTALSPFFKVRDFGTGLSTDDIREIYSRYGTSTKRDSNDVVGMLGLGCKSALTYCDQFTLTSTKAGRTVQVLISRDEDGSGSMTIVSDSRDGREQGTEIIVPVKRTNDFDAKASDFFRFWKAGEVLVNGSKPKRIDGIWLSDDTLLSTEVQHDTVVMGNVPYPFLADDADRYSSRNGYGYDGITRRSYRLVAFVPIGEVQFTPSREALQATKATKEALETLRQKVALNRDRAVERMVREAPTPSEAVAALKRGKEIGFKGELTYKGRRIVTSFDRSRDPKGDKIVGLPLDPADYTDYTASFLTTASGRRTKVAGQRTWAVNFTDPDTVWFEGFDGKELTPTKRAKLLLWASQNGLGENFLNARSNLVAVKSLTTDERYWLTGQTIYQWADVDAIKLPKDAAPVMENGRPKGSYEGIVAGVKGSILASDIDTSKPVRWVQGNQWNLEGHDAFRFGALSRDEGTYVALAGNRIEKFLRDFPMAVEIDVAAKNAAQATKDSLPKEAVQAYVFQTMHSGVSAKLHKLDPERVDDPDLKAAINLSRVVLGIASSDRMRNLRRYITFEDVKLPVTGKVLAAYPLLEGQTYGLDNGAREHAYLYVNAAYQAARM